MDFSIVRVVALVGFIAVANVPALAGELTLAMMPGSGGTVAEGGEDWHGPTLVIYEAGACPADGAIECSLVSMSCDDALGRGLTISIDGLDLKQIEKWDAAGLKITIRGIVPEASLEFGELLKSDPAWSAVFYGPYSSDPGLTLDGGNIVVEGSPRPIAVKLTDDRKAMLKDFAEQCARE